MALDEPQVICAKLSHSMSQTHPELTHHLTPTSHHSPLTRVNQEARSEALKVQFPVVINDANIPMHINPQLDTLLVDSLCWGLASAIMRGDHKIYRIATTHKSLERLWAGDFADYGDEAYWEACEEFIDCLISLTISGVQDIFLVVGHHDLTTCEDIIFESPRYSAHHSCVNLETFCRASTTKGTPKDTWRIVEQDANQFLEEMLVGRREMYQDNCELHFCEKEKITHHET